MPALDVPCVQAFLDEFARSYPESLNLLLWDGAPAHIAHALVVPPNVVLIQLPAYCPELIRAYSPQQLASLCGYEYLLRSLLAPSF